MPNIKWFDKLTTLRQVEGQITMTKIQNTKPDTDLEEKKSIQRIETNTVIVS